MQRKQLKLEQALLALPDVPSLAPFREALLGVSRTDPEAAWSGSAAYATLDKRLTDLDGLEASLPELVQRVARRAESTFRHTLEALRALEREHVAEAAGELIRAGEIAESARLLDEAQRFYRAALQLGRKPRDRQGEGLARRRLARVARARGEWILAQEEFERSLEIAQATGDQTGIMLAHQGLGNVLVDQGRWAEARKNYLCALEAIGDSPPADFLHLCNAFSVVARRQGKLDESEQWLRWGERVAGEVTDEVAVEYLEHGRARLLMANEDWEGAEAVLIHALSRTRDPMARTSALLNLAEAVQEQGRLDEAERLVREAEDLAFRSRMTLYLPYVYRALGDLALRRRDPDGFLFFEQALSVIRRQKLPPSEEAAALFHYARFEAATGEHAQARARLELARERFSAIGAEVELREVEAELCKLDRAGAP